MRKEAPRFAEGWTQSASRLVDAEFSARWSAPTLPSGDRDLPDADLDALAESMLASLRKSIDDLPL